VQASKHGSDWEAEIQVNATSRGHGQKKPNGPSLTLLNLLHKKGLEALA
jgi:hypothetical protein